jgi:hypothetical protein
LELLPVLRIIDGTIGAIDSCKWLQKAETKWSVNNNEKIKGFNSLLVKKNIS